MEKFGPLFLPQGSVRSILAFIIVFGVMVAVFKQIPIPEGLWTAFGLVIVLYFNDSRNQAQEKKNEQLEEELRVLKNSQPVVVPTEIENLKS